MHLVGRVCSCLAEESRLIDRRILVLSQMVTALRLIPSVPRPSSVSVVTQTVVQTYADASVEALTLGTRAQIPTGYMVKTLRSQSTCDSNMPSDQMLSTF